MKSYVKEFTYPTKEGDVSHRKLFVMREDATAVDGIELTYLDEDVQKEVVSALKEHEIKDNFSKSEGEIDGYKSEWGKAWRRYTKARILPEEKEK